MSFNTPLPGEFSDPWYSGLQSAWTAITNFVNGLKTRLDGHDTTITSHGTSIGTLNTEVGTLNTEVGALDTRTTTLEGTTAGLTTSVGSKVSKATSGAPNATVGWWQKLDLTSYSTNGTDAEPWIINGFRGAAHRAFWANENGSPRGASINDEPALKLFGPEANTSYAGLVFQVLNRWAGAQSQQNLFGVNMAGKPIIGTAGTIVGAWTIVLAAADPIPSGLPAGTVIVRLAA
jgi:hypothetical protein